MTTTPGYWIEARIPWHVLGVSNPEVGSVFGTNFNVSDGDGSFRMMVSSNPERVQTRPGTWNTLVLGWRFIMSAITNYLDLDVLVEKEGDGYRARVIGSPGGQASSDFRPPFSPLELENFLLRVGMSLSEIRRNVRRIDSSEMAEIKSFGGRLFRALFDEQLQPTLVRSLDEARRRQAGLRLRLRLSDAPELADLPWEYLYDTGANRFLNLSVETPLIRYLELPEPGRALTVQPPLKILVMISAPTDVARARRRQRMEPDHLCPLRSRGRGLVALERLETATMAALQRTLRRGEYHIFHYVGHGGYDEQTQDGVLLLEGMDGRAPAGERTGPRDPAPRSPIPSSGGPQLLRGCA